ncbi:type IX secretion system outer membrane channel protein PorV [Mucilaginibacter boryungensis]|uniref:Type IX secretion system outer membrane channel protein PorV n=1 Tax=Mucilaginibacter boryungensis TaxID=768480 RepID=A0ABR9XNE1_9SPHI|nr:type IX secretion system outer membrane channel protein PorV [Mucilaginibacter boryungensis]MBE9668771.1 type IX secretion system outer membrane channel protein PorV [Mucilaginibacter boryungensis]
MKSIGPLFFLLVLFNISLGQSINTNGGGSNSIFTAVPFLTIAPDARSGAMGDAGAALSPTEFDTHWNPSKLAFLDNDNHISLSYSPWLRHVAPDANLAYLNFAKKIDERNAIGFSFCYFNLGKVNVYDANEVPLGSYQPNEFSFDATLARKFGANLSLGLSARFIHSAIISSDPILGSSGSHAGNALAADVSLFYKKSVQQFKREAQFSYGIHISNIGTKVNYYTGGDKYFLPTNLRIGIADEIAIDQLNTFTFAFDINKLLVPTPPIRDAGGNIISGSDDNKSIVSGIFSSFGDAPGGFSEELKEIAFSPGIEYMYNKQFAIRTGYFYENPAKGDRRYLTLGAGYKYQEFGLDFSYLIASQSTSPLANTLRFTLRYSFAGKLKGGQ